MERFDASFRVGDRPFQRHIETGFGFGEFGLAHCERRKLAAVVAAGQRAQTGVAVGAYLVEDARHSGRQLRTALLHGAAQRGTTRVGIERGPFDARQFQGFLLRVHARIFSTGNTSNWLAPARFMSSRWVHVTAP